MVPKTTTMRKSTQAAMALRELGFIDTALEQQRGRRAYLRGEEPSYPEMQEGWFRVYRDSRARGTRVKIEVRLGKDADEEELLKAEEAILSVVPNARSGGVGPGTRMLTIVWLEPLVSGARAR